jgi:hypothetical protein
MSACIYDKKIFIVESVVDKTETDDLYLHIISFDIDTRVITKLCYFKLDIYGSDVNLTEGWNQFSPYNLMPAIYVPSQRNIYFFTFAINNHIWNSRSISTTVTYANGSTPTTSPTHYYSYYEKLDFHIYKYNIDFNTLEIILDNSYSHEYPGGNSSINLATIRTYASERMTDYINPKVNQYQYGSTLNYDNVNN